MTEQISKGVRGRAVGPLRPAGRIRVDTQTFEARSEGAWIDADAEVIVVGRTSFGLIVRPASEVCEKPAADPPPAELSGSFVSETTPLHAPAALIEKIGGLAFGAVAAVCLAGIGLLTGRPFNVFILSTPVAGLAAGFILLWCVRGASDFVGPRVDHRPLAYVVTLMTAIGGAMGLAFGLSSGFGFLGLSAGLVLGTFLGGAIAWGGMILMT